MARLDCCGGSRTHDTPHGGKSKLSGQGLRVRYSLNGDPLSALRCLATADVLVVAKSSFSNVAAALSYGIKVYVPPDAASKHTSSQRPTSRPHAGSSRGGSGGGGGGGGGSHVRNMDRDAMLTFLTEMTDEAEWVAVRPVKAPSETAGGKTGSRASTDAAAAPAGVAVLAVPG